MRFFHCLWIFGLFVTEVNAQTQLIWLRPISHGVEVDGVNIVSGPELTVMKTLAQGMLSFEHSFESYPLKRNWLLIKNALADDRVYCFYGASITEERKQWGYFSEPTSILLPYPIVAKQGHLDTHIQNGAVSLQTLLENGMTTLLFDGAVNIWTRAVKRFSPSETAYLTFNSGQRDDAELSMQLLVDGRIDFAYIGSGDTEISKLQRAFNTQLTVYQVAEFANHVRQGNRVMCSKSAAGLNAVSELNASSATILSNAKTNTMFRDLNFAAIGYHPELKASFDYHWQGLGN